MANYSTTIRHKINLAVNVRVRDALARKIDFQAVDRPMMHAVLHPAYRAVTLGVQDVVNAAVKGEKTPSRRARRVVEDMLDG